MIHFKINYHQAILRIEIYCIFRKLNSSNQTRKDSQTKIFSATKTFFPVSSISLLKTAGTGNDYQMDLDCSKFSTLDKSFVNGFPNMIIFTTCEQTSLKFP